MKRALNAQRGSALIGVMALMAILFGFVVAVMVYSGSERRRAIYNARLTSREDCAHAGLELSRAFFGRNFKSWNKYLASPSVYNPIVNATFNPTPVDPTNSTLWAQPTYAGLFADLDGDNKPDVFLYIRDNEDEFPPKPNNPARDNDQTVIAGAMCISTTMVPPRNGQIDTDPVVVEGLLMWNQRCTGYNQNGTNCGGGNLN